MSSASRAEAACLARLPLPLGQFPECTPRGDLSRLTKLSDFHVHLHALSLPHFHLHSLFLSHLHLYQDRVARNSAGHAARPRVYTVAACLSRSITSTSPSRLAGTGSSWWTARDDA